MAWRCSCLTLLALLLLPGCNLIRSAPDAVSFSGPGASLVLRSQTATPTILSGKFDHALYSLDEKSNVTVVLIEGDIDRPTQAATLRLFWKPRAGATPIDRTATNATIQYLVFAGDEGREVGVYSGAGYAFPSGKLGKPVLNLDVWDASLRLSDRSDRFSDLLGKAALTGSIRATRDDEAVADLLQNLQVLATSGLGYPRMVEAR